MKIGNNVKLKIGILIMLIFIVTTTIIGAFKIIPKSKAQIVAATAFAGGTGTLADPYQISNAAELLYFANQVNTRANIYSGKYVELIANIDLGEIENWVPIGCLSSSNGYRNADSTGFRGTFNGNNYTISNLNISVSTANLKNTCYAIGLFGAIHSGTVKNLKLNNVNIEIAEGFTATLGNDMSIGALIGKTIQNSRVYNIEVNNFTFNDYSRVSNLNEKFYSVGGVTGDIITNSTTNANSVANKVDNCIVRNANINTDADATNTTKAKQYFVGGIAGRVRYQSIYPTNCVFSGTVVGNAYVSPTVAGGIIPASANHSDFNTISGVSISDNSITNLLYYNTTVTKQNGNLPNQTYNKRTNSEGEYDPLGTEISGTIFKSYVDDLNTTSQANESFYNWKSVNGKIVFDYGQTSSSIYITGITDTTATLVAVINNYIGQDMAYEWKDSQNNVVGTNNEVVINLKSYAETITLKISTASGDFSDTIELPKGNLIRASINANRTGINYSLEATLIGATQTGNYTFQWKENDAIIVGANTSTYIAKLGATAKNVKVIITDLSNNIEYEETYSIPALILSLELENTQQLQAKINAVFKIEEEVITDIIEEITYSWNISGNTVTTIVPNTYVNLKMQTQTVSLSVSSSNLNLQATNTIEIEPVNLNIIFSKNVANKSITATLGGIDISKIDISKFSYQWYFIIDNQENLINGATSNQLNNVLLDNTYKLKATYQENNEIIIEGCITMSKNVIFVDYNNGIETNSGTTSLVPVKTLNKAYEILASINENQITKEEDNIIVIMGNYSDTTNHFGSGTDSVFTVPATITGTYDNVDYLGVLYFFGGDSNTSEVKKLQANTKFEYLKFNGNSSSTGYAYLYAQGYNLTMGKGISMINYSADTSDSHGLSLSTKATAFHILGGHFNYNETTINKGTDEPCIITIESGSYARIIAGGRNTITNEVSKNIYATRENPFNVIINISYEGAEHATPYQLDSTTGRRFADIGLVCGGQTDGAGYFNTTINYNNGVVGRFVGGSLGNRRVITVNNIQYDTNYFVGDLQLNINGGYIHEFYGGSLGRYTGEITHNGHININMTGGTINNNVFSTGASAITGKVNNKSIVNFVMSGGIINGNVYGGAYGYSTNIDAGQASTNSGILYGDISIRVSGGIINGTVYGGGKGTDAYATDSSKQALARVIGDINIIIEDKAKINGSVYGAGEGYTQYRDMAEVIGNTQISIQNQYNLMSDTSSSIIIGDIHGAGRAARLAGNATINMNNMRIGGSVYGGGKTADITGNVRINVNSGTYILKSLYGGGENGVVGDSESPTTVDIYINGNASITEDLYGGGENALTNSYITMDINKLVILGDIHGGGKSGLVDEDVSVTIDKIDITGNIFGGGENANVIGNIDMSVISGTIRGDIYGGGNLGQVQGNTNLLIGDVNSDETITAQGITYAGGKGANSTDITVTENSQATIAGMNTNITSYGSSELGAVQGDVDITFNNYKNRSSNNRYKNMTGINKATNLDMINSYVYLTGGMQNITNMHLPQGSGILISEDSRIDGNFNGGGILYLKSEVCFTINGNILANSSTTTLTLNPEKLENSYLIKGNINYPYVVVKGTDYLQNTTDKAFTSGYQTQYSILNATNATQNSIYYIERDVEINTYIGVVSVLQEGKDYSALSAITEENCESYGDVNIIEEDSFTVKGTIQYTHVGTINDILNGTKFKNITRQISLQENYTNITIPMGTRVTLIDEDGMYGYYVGQDTTIIPISAFKDIETKSNISELRDISDKVTAYQDNTVRYEEDFKVIFDFSDCEDGIAPGVYNFELTISDEETEDFNSKNMVEIENNNYNFNYEFNKEAYLSKNNVRLNANFTMEDVNYTVNNALTTDIYAIITFENQQNQKIQIPKGTILKIDNNEISTNRYYSMFEVIEDINNTRNRTFALDLDMQKCLNYLSEGTYSINFDFYLTNGNTLKSCKIYNEKCNFNIVNGQNYGIEAEIININKNDKKQLINEENATKTIKVDIEKGNLIGTNVKVLLQERISPFTYENITNTVSQTIIDDINTTRNITATFGNEIDNGMYRLVFELYDNNNYKYCEDSINIFVQR